MPAIVPWWRSTPLTWERPAAARIAAERLDGEVVAQRVGAERGDAGHVLGASYDVGGEALLGAGLGDVEPAAVVEHDAQRERPTCDPARGGSRRHLVAPADPAGPGEVDHEVQAGGVDVEELAVAGDVVDEGALERLQRRVEGLERAERGDVDGA